MSAIWLFFKLQPIFKQMLVLVLLISDNIQSKVPWVPLGIYTMYIKSPGMWDKVVLGHSPWYMWVSCGTLHPPPPSCPGWLAFPAAWSRRAWWRSHSVASGRTGPDQTLAQWIWTILDGFQHTAQSWGWSEQTMRLSSIPFNWLEFHGTFYSSF